ncbi:hypothetical protein NMY22_g16282 [Coprinellus aureogranulatus]|nr:hypothetical protein NMY22_g16282 [Coprinellus aureogranulatus]
MRHLQCEPTNARDRLENVPHPPLNFKSESRSPLPSPTLYPRVSHRFVDVTKLPLCFTAAPRRNDGLPDWVPSSNLICPKVAVPQQQVLNPRKGYWEKTVLACQGQSSLADISSNGAYNANLDTINERARDHQAWVQYRLLCDTSKAEILGFGREAIPYLKRKVKHCSERRFYFTIRPVSSLSFSFSLSLSSSPALARYILSHYNPDSLQF